MIYTYNEMGFNHKKEETTDTCYNMNETKTLCQVKEDRPERLHSALFHVLEKEKSQD